MSSEHINYLITQLYSSQKVTGDRAKNMNDQLRNNGNDFENLKQAIHSDVKKEVLQGGPISGTDYLENLRIPPNFNQKKRMESFLIGMMRKCLQGKNAFLD